MPPRATRALVLGIGGGGDAVGCLAVARHLEARVSNGSGRRRVGAASWWTRTRARGRWPRSTARTTARRPRGARRSRAGATTPEGVHFCESRLAGLPRRADRPDRHHRRAAPARRRASRRRPPSSAATWSCWSTSAATRSPAGDEPGLASPLCDAVMIAGGAQRSPTCRASLGVLGAGLRRRAAARRGRSRGSPRSRGPGPGSEPRRHARGGRPRSRPRAEVAVTEASLLVARCARGEIGEVEIRGGRRDGRGGAAGRALLPVRPRAPRSPELPLARAVAGAAVDRRPRTRPSSGIGVGDRARLRDAPGRRGLSGSRRAWGYP